MTSDLHHAFYRWAIQLSDNELGELLPDTAWKLVGCSKAEPKLYKPAQEARMAEDAMQMWHRSPAGQYWGELHRKYPGNFDTIIKLHEERFPGDGGPIDENERPAPPAPPAPKR